MDQIICTLLPDGNLELTLADDDEARDWLVEGLAKRTSDDMLWEGTERYWTNGMFQPFDAGDANPFVGLSSAPCVAEDMDIDDDGTKTINGRFWAFLDYQIRDFADVLLADGRVVFTLVE